MTDDLQAYIDKRYAAASFRVVPGHLPTFYTKDDVDKFFGDMERQLASFIEMEPVTQYQLDMMAHAVGLDHHKPYTRSGKLHYKAHRNYYGATDSGKDHEAWEKLVEGDYAVKSERYGSTYYLTNIGLEYVAKRFGIAKITEVDWWTTKNPKLSNPPSIACMASYARAVHF